MGSRADDIDGVRDDGFFGQVFGDDDCLGARFNEDVSQEERGLVVLVDSVLQKALPFSLVAEDLIGAPVLEGQRMP